MCIPCDPDSETESEDPDPCGSGTCVTLRGKSFCSLACEDGAGCPDGYRCAKTDSGAKGCTPDGDVECRAPCQPGWDDCNGDPSDGCETRLADDQHCGACENDCLAYFGERHGVGECRAGECSLLRCKEGWRDCNLFLGDGCEIDLQVDSANCGACGNPCRGVFANNAGRCFGGSCVFDPAHCSDGFADCDASKATGCETLLGTEEDCAYCRNDCSTVFPHAEGTCLAGSCRMTACLAGYQDCDGFSTNGCEARLGIDTRCASCDDDCTSLFANAFGQCLQGVCGFGSCRVFANGTKYSDCDGEQANGCETALGTKKDCSKCADDCTKLPHVNDVSCQKPPCIETDCEAGKGDCDGYVGNGCETVLSSLLPRCLVYGCLSGWGDCDGQAATGCETDLSSGTSHCGGCKTDCLDAPNVAAARCASGSCAILACRPGWADCNQSVSDGCEKYVAGDSLYCGSCDNDCTSLPHVKDVACEDGRCAIAACDDGWADCAAESNGGCETHIDDDVSRCGSCGQDCTQLPYSSGVTCHQGQCMIDTCEPHRGDCNDAFIDGCEVEFLSDLQHCGNCSRDCRSLAHTKTVACRVGECAIDECAGDWKDCNGAVSDGCEADTRSDPLRCGACDHDCTSLPQVVDAYCGSGVCLVSTCMAGWHDCNGDGSDGCESDLLGGVGTCGSCDEDCRSLPFVKDVQCNEGYCAIATCLDGRGNCNGYTDDGCETNVLASPFNCGHCGNPCTSNQACKAGTCTTLP